MNSEMLEDILACPSLPSLPAVALRVIELCADPNVKIAELARTIQNDQALSAKVLRTVNSSFYGLRERCGTINKALVMLGLSPVKSLVLGFSLVSSVEVKDGDAFDYQDYWRRGLYTAVGGKCIVEAAGKKFGDEVFLAGLLQDVGVMAMYKALGDDYLRVMKLTKGDHRQLVKCELTAYEVQHPEIGAMLAQRWKMPDSLVLPVKYHERPTATPPMHTEIVHAVGLGNMIHDVITSDEPTESLRRLYAKAEQWLGMKGDSVDTVLERSRAATKEMAGLFKLDIGTTSSAADLERRAEDQLASIDANQESSPPAMAGVELMLIDPADVDPRTGIMGRKGFDFAVRRAFKVAREEGEPASLLNVVVDASIFGPNPASSATAAMGAVALLKKHFGPMGAAICSLSPWIYAIVTVGASGQEIVRGAEEFRAGLVRMMPPTSGTAGLSASVGVVHFGAPHTSAFNDPIEVVKAAAQAVLACKSAGGNRVTTFERKAA